MSTRQRATPIAATLLLALAACSLVIAACGGDVNVEPTGGESPTTAGPGGSGGAGGAGGAGGDDGQIPLACRSNSGADTTLGVIFHLENGGDTPVYLRNDCERGLLRIDACPDGEPRTLSLFASCSAECSADPYPGCTQCEPCAPTAAEIGPQTEHAVTWKGTYFTFGADAENCTCHNTLQAPAARYLLRVPVYATAADAEQDVAPRWVSGDFELPQVGGSITLSLTPRATP
ncbi:hypothetical protein [Chondromyces crocatus]|uniref:Secreted protein n=1 Tax=Chondromyces crocatus TaxID=52 RepID=A0A0K1EQ42_CHOCO|nr:hypothetical protein [Chondromyces crocatus]AKT42733.1 uncharacterized protein CMC5_069600 [Chondromyces crocatus]